MEHKALKETVVILEILLVIIIRESVDSLYSYVAECAEMRTKWTRQVGNSKAFKGLHCATEVLLYLIVRSK